MTRDEALADCARNDLPTRIAWRLVEGAVRPAEAVGWIAMGGNDMIAPLGLIVLIPAKGVPNDRTFFNIPIDRITCVEGYTGDSNAPFWEA